MGKKLKKIRAISPVIAEIIIVAIAIAVSIAVAGWLMGLWGGYTRTEQLQIISALSTVDSTGSFTIVVKNTGDTTSRIIAIKISNSSTNQMKADGTTPPITITPGAIITINGTVNVKLVPGSTVTVSVITDSGKQFSGAVTVQ